MSELHVGCGRGGGHPACHALLRVAGMHSITSQITGSQLRKSLLLKCPSLFDCSSEKELFSRPLITPERTGENNGVKLFLLD